ncbi:MAG TPA: hypothetical protein DDW50_04840 [Firmicutes bacterium]|jgi:uncharacterized membrane protein SpoIIM required for sporulation|nr:hypothetical protein [Bacillota bacterium]
MAFPFIQIRQKRWTRLQQLLIQAEKKKLSSFSKAEIIELSVLYRQAATDLAAAKTQGLPDDLIRFLNDLVGRSYHYIYRTKKTTLRQLGYFITTEFPDLFRQNWPVILFSLIILFVGWLAGFLGYQAEPEFMKKILPNEFTKNILQGYLKKTWFNDPLVSRPYISSFIMYNNIRVAIQAFGGGMLLGILTCWAVLFNGFILGVLSAVFLKHGHLLSFWAMILPHGVIELTAISLSAAAGLLLTRAILFPGDLSRSDALKISGVKAVKLLSGTVIMLVVAGLIEGFFSTISTKLIPESFRLLFATVTGILLWLYFKPRPIQNKSCLFK